MTWYDTSNCPRGWNITGVNMTISNMVGDTPAYKTNIAPAANFIVELQTAYPYISLPKSSFDTFLNQVNTDNLAYASSFKCDSMGKSKMCYW